MLDRPTLISNLKQDGEMKTQLGNSKLKSLTFKTVTLRTIPFTHSSVTIVSLPIVITKDLIIHITISIVLFLLLTSTWMTKAIASNSHQHLNKRRLDITPQVTTPPRAILPHLVWLMTQLSECAHS
jgi:hypothetical protein